MRKIVTLISLVVRIILVCVSADATNGADIFNSGETPIQQDGPFWMLVAGLLSAGIGARGIWHIWGTPDRDPLEPALD